MPRRTNVSDWSKILCGSMLGRRELDPGIVLILTSLSSLHPMRTKRIRESHSRLFRDMGWAGSKDRRVLYGVLGLAPS